MQTVKFTLAACAAALALAACGGSSGGSTGGGPAGGGSTSGGGTTSAGDCKQQGEQWKKDNTQTLKDFQSAIQGFTSGTPTKASAKKLEDVANEAASHPIPSCADPKGLWSKAMHQVALAGKAASKGGIEAEAAALPALKKALDDINALQAEVKKKVDLGTI